MGAGSSKNDDFSSNPRFNMQVHNEAMRNLSGNYVDSGFNVPSNNSRQAEIQKTQFKQIQRTCSIYKPSLHIVPLPIKDAFLLEFDYDSLQNCVLEIYVGVVEVVQDSNSNITQTIRSKVVEKRQLLGGKKLRFSNEVSLHGFSGLETSNFILRLISQVANEKTQYSLRKVRQPNNHWKVLLEKLELNGRVTQLQNIYKGDETAQCIICLSTTSNTLISPCNHLCLCQECLESVRKTTNKCPICRTAISNFKVIVNSS